MYLQVSSPNLDYVIKVLCLRVKGIAKFCESRDEAIVDFVNGSNVHCSGEPEYELAAESS